MKGCLKKCQIFIQFHIPFFLVPIFTFSFRLFLTKLFEITVISRRHVTHVIVPFSYLECPDCYSLVQDKVNAHRQKLEDLKNLLQNIGENPEVVSDVNFEKQLKALEAELDVAVVEAERAISKCTVKQEGCSGGWGRRGRLGLVRWLMGKCKRRESNIRDWKGVLDSWWSEQWKRGKGNWFSYQQQWVTRNRLLFMQKLTVLF